MVLYDKTDWLSGNNEFHILFSVCSCFAFDATIDEFADIHTLIHVS